MKKLFIITLGLILINTAYAYDHAKLRMKISGPVHDNKYFMCLNKVGCVSIYAATKGKIYPLDAGKIDRMIAVNIKNRRMYVQEIPESCNVNISEKQTLTVSGRLIEGPNNAVRVHNLRCSVS